MASLSRARSLAHPRCRPILVTGAGEGQATRALGQFASPYFVASALAALNVHLRTPRAARALAPRLARNLPQCHVDPLAGAGNRGDWPPEGTVRYSPRSRPARGGCDAHTCLAAAAPFPARRRRARRRRLGRPLRAERAAPRTSAPARP